MNCRLIRGVVPVKLEDTEEYKRALSLAFRARMLEEVEMWSKHTHAEHLKTYKVRRITSHWKLGD